MQAVILAAGRGTRLLPLTQDVPKALAPINDKPILEIILSQLKEVGVTDIIIIVHHLQEEIHNYCADSSFEMKITCVEQKEMKGTADAVLQAEPYIHDDKFLCIAADSLFETELLHQLLKETSDGVITCKEVKDTKQWGILKVDGDKVLDMVEKPDDPPSNLANFSVYVFPKEIFAACKKVKLSKRGELEINDAIKMLINSGMYFTYIKCEHIIDIGTPEKLEKAEILAEKLGL
jgi:dTDP-glucose pyrophosphorylase